MYIFWARALGIANPLLEKYDQPAWTRHATHRWIQRELNELDAGDARPGWCICVSKNDACSGFYIKFVGGVGAWPTMIGYFSYYGEQQTMIGCFS